MVGAQTSMNFATLRGHVFVSDPVTLKPGIFTDVKALFPVISMDFRLLVHVKSWKNLGRVYFNVYYDQPEGALLKTSETWHENNYTINVYLICKINMEGAIICSKRFLLWFSWKTNIF